MNSETQVDDASSSNFESPPSQIEDAINSDDDMDQNSGDDSREMSSDDYGDDDSSDGELLGKVALAFDPTQLSGNELPQNGHDYLKLVQEERAKYPQVATAPLPATSDKSTSKPKSNQDLVSDTTDSINDTGLGSRLKKNSNDDILYRDEILKNFRNLRQKIDEIRQSIEPTAEQKATIAKQKIDLSQDVMAAMQSNAEEEHKKQLSRSRSGVESLIKSISIGDPPRVSTLIRKSQMEIHMALECLAEQCEAAPNYSTIHADWIYSLMAALHEPIEADICSTLRRLAKISIVRKQSLEKKTRIKNMRNARDKNDSDRKTGHYHTHTNQDDSVGAVEEEEYTSCLLIIGIVRHHFGQVDLSS